MNVSINIATIPPVNTLKPEGLFPTSILPKEVQESLAAEIRQKLDRTLEDVPAEQVYHPPPNFAAKTMLKLLGQKKSAKPPTTPLLYLRRGRQTYDGAINVPFDYTVVNEGNTAEEYTEGPFPPALAAAMAYLYQECSGIQSQAYNPEVASELGVNYSRSLAEGMIHFANQISLLAKTAPYAPNVSGLISTVVDRQTQMYQMNLDADWAQLEATGRNSDSSDSLACLKTERIKVTEDHLAAVRYGERLLTDLVAFPWLSITPPPISLPSAR